VIELTAIVLTFNEAPNIGRTLSKLSWLRDVVVVDSGSSDETVRIALTHPNVRVFERPFTSHADQWNFGLEQTNINTDWVLALDADFVLTDEFVSELRGLSPATEVAGYRASFRYCINGTPLRSAVYPPVTVLYRRLLARYEQDGHTQRVQVRGPVEALQAEIQHDDRKALSHWIASQVRYMRLEADKLAAAPSSSLATVDRIRRLIVVAPPMMLVVCLVGRGGLLDGWPGIYYALQRTAAELILSLTLVERRLFGPRTATAPSD
jgi:glycosyltransferase involved in cell wall biosynthesis